MMTYQELWQRLTPLYDDNEAKAIVRMVLDIRFGMSLSEIYMGKVTKLSANDCAFLEKILVRLEKGEPVQYVLGETEFAGHRFKVGKGVLIPRPETAELCQWIIDEHLTPRHRMTETSTIKILDIGTGSGCIAITLALASKTAKVTAWDISPTALAMAEENAHALGADIVTEQHDIVDEATGTTAGEYHMIVSNPPYICQHERAAMEENVLAHEPHIALFVPDDDPLLFYRAIANFATHHLAKGGWLYFEINPTYADELTAMLQERGFTGQQLHTDQFGKLRMVRVRRP